MDKRFTALLMAMFMIAGSTQAFAMPEAAAENGTDSLIAGAQYEGDAESADDMQSFIEAGEDLSGCDSDVLPEEAVDEARDDSETVGSVGGDENETEIEDLDGDDGSIDVQEINVDPIKTDISNASIAGVSLSYGYSGKAYTPAMTVTVNGKVLVEGTDYTVKYANNKYPGTATITITGRGKYKGKRVKTFQIVDCVSALISGRTYQLVPKNNSKTAVCAFSGRMVNNTKVYITDRSRSEAMRFRAIKNADGSWKFINAKCELALAVQQNSSEVGKGLVLYRQTDRKAQNWKLSKKSDNSFAIINAVSGLSVAMSDASAVKGTTLSMAEAASSGLQRFYIIETDPVDNHFDGLYAVRAEANIAYALNIASASTKDGANVNLYKYSHADSQKFQIVYSGSGYYRLINVNSGLVLTVKGNTKTNGANVIQSAWSARDGQRWKITVNDDATVTFTNVLGTILHLVSNSTKNNSNIVAKNRMTTKAQKWVMDYQGYVFAAQLQ